MAHARRQPKTICQFSEPLPRRRILAACRPPSPVTLCRSQRYRKTVNCPSLYRRTPTRWTLMVPCPFDNRYSNTCCRPRPVPVFTLPMKCRVSALAYHLVGPLSNWRCAKRLASHRCITLNRKLTMTNCRTHCNLTKTSSQRGWRRLMNGRHHPYNTFRCPLTKLIPFVLARTVRKQSALCTSQKVAV